MKTERERGRECVREPCSRMPRADREGSREEAIYIRIRRTRRHQRSEKEFAGRWERFREREIN